MVYEYSLKKYVALPLLDAYCTYSQGSGNGKTKIQMKGKHDHQSCANKCFQVKRDGREDINGATFANNKCHCEVQQTRILYSEENMNCQFTETTTPMQVVEGIYIHSLFSVDRLHMLVQLPYVGSTENYLLSFHISQF